MTEPGNLPVSERCDWACRGIRPSPSDAIGPVVEYARLRAMRLGQPGNMLVSERCDWAWPHLDVLAELVEELCEADFRRPGRRVVHERGPPQPHVALVDVLVHRGQTLLRHRVASLLRPHPKISQWRGSRGGPEGIYRSSLDA
eukprot:6560792-Pyramimonas_sp.AAC.1